MSQELNRERLLWLATQWQTAKRAEQTAVEERRKLEDEMTALLGVDPAFEGTMREKLDGIEIKLTARMNRKVDAERVQEIAAEIGATEHLAALFRWKPEINAAAWKAAALSITSPLSRAITTTPGRPSFEIMKGE